MASASDPNELIEYTVRDHIGAITLSRPPANAFSVVMYKRLASIAELVAADDSVNVCVFAAREGPIFCGGADVNELATLDGRGREDFFRVSSRTRELFTAIPVPVIAAITGHCAGAGVTYATRSDYRIVSSAAQFCMPEIDRGSVAGGGIDMMAVGVPSGPLRMMLYSGARYTADQVARMHLVDEVVNPDDVLVTAWSWAERLSRKSRRALVQMKRAIGLMSRQLAGSEEAFRETQRMTVSLMDVGDSREGLAAFVEKREPQY